MVDDISWFFLPSTFFFILLITKLPFLCGYRGAANHSTWPHWLVQGWARDLYSANQSLPPGLFCIWSYQGKALFFLVLELKEYEPGGTWDHGSSLKGSPSLTKEKANIYRIWQKKNLTMFKFLVSVTPKASSHSDSVLIWLLDPLKFSSFGISQFLFVLKLPIHHLLQPSILFSFYSLHSTYAPLDDFNWALAFKLCTVCWWLPSLRHHTRSPPCLSHSSINLMLTNFTLITYYGMAINQFSWGQSQDRFTPVA